MDESDPNESNYDTDSDTNGPNESDNKLAQYKMINKELSKLLVGLKAENAKLRNNYKELSLENLTCRNELTSHRNEITKWRRKFTRLETMHVRHVETLTSELQSYADKLTGVFGNSDDEDGETEVRNRVTEQQSTAVKSTSISGDTSPRVSKSLVPSKPVILLPDPLDENPSNLNTINEESEESMEVSDSEQISLVTSTHEATLTDDAKPSETLSITNGTKTIVFRKSASDTCEMASMDSNKENERPSTFISSNSTLADENHPSTITATETVLKQSIMESVTPLKEKFVTQRRTKKRTLERNSFEGTKTPELVSSTPYTRKRSGTHSDLEVKTATPVRSTDSDRITRRSAASISSSGRPKRKVSTISFAEPKLNTKMRRPRS